MIKFVTDSAMLKPGACLVVYRKDGKIKRISQFYDKTECLAHTKPLPERWQNARNCKIIGYIQAF